MVMGKQHGRWTGGTVSEDLRWLGTAGPGSVVAGYRIESPLGAGGMAVVFRAWDKRLGRMVALKLLAPQWAADPQFRLRFIAESRAAAAVDDPHVIPVYEAGEVGGLLFIAMRLVDGPDLRAVIRREGPMPPDRALELLSPVASALDSAHEAGLIHRDVKPANILVHERPGHPDHVYLSDFGLSKTAATGAVSLTGTGQFLGTPNYCSPEQCQGRPVDGRADQYSLACVAFQLLTGHVPFERENVQAILFAHVTAPPPPLTGRRPDLPVAVDAVMAKALAKSPGDRYPSCSDFTHALRGAAGPARHQSRVAQLPAAHGLRRPHDGTGVIPARTATLTPPPAAHRGIPADVIAESRRHAKQQATVNGQSPSARLNRKLLMASAGEEAGSAARNLAQRFGKRIESQSIHLKLKAPRPLKVRWREVSAYGDHISPPSLAGELEDIKVVFDKVRAGSGAERPGRLVILGPGGSGKSVLLQQLALKILEDPGPSGTVPVIFSLSSWQAGTALDDWLTAQLLRLRYDPGLSEEVARSIVANRLILPLLDGFDEVGAGSRAELLDMLNGDAGRELVLASRREEYMNSARGRGGANGTVLSGASVIELTPLPLEEATDYLRSLPHSRARHGSVEPAWEPVTRTLQSNPGLPAARRLAEVFEKPLMVAIARDVYRHKDPAELFDDTRFTSVTEIENHLLDNFIPAIYDGKAENPSRWGKHNALRAFRYLASLLEPADGNGPRRQDIAWWDIGTAGITPLKRCVLTGLAGGLAWAFAYVIWLFAAYVAGVHQPEVSPVFGLAAGLGYVAVVGFAFGFAHWLTIKHKPRLLEPSRASIKFFGTRGGGRRGQHRLRDVVRRFWSGLAFGGVAVFPGTFAAWAYGFVLDILVTGKQYDVRESLVFVLVTALGASLGIALLVGVIVGFAVLLEVPAEEEAVGPLALLAANRRIAILLGLAMALTGGLVAGIATGLIDGPAGGLAAAVTDGITLGTGVVLCVSAWGQWVVFCRIWLPLTGKLPWRTRAFLDDAHQRGVLRQIGGVYQFRHARLQSRVAGGQPRHSYLRANYGARAGRHARPANVSWRAP